MPTSSLAPEKKSSENLIIHQLFIQLFSICALAAVFALAAFFIHSNADIEVAGFGLCLAIFIV